MPADGGPVRNLTTAWTLDPGPPRWSGDGRTIYFTADARGNAHLFAVQAAGGEVRQVTHGERQLRGFTLSRDGHTLAYTAGDVTHPAELYVAPLAARGPGAERRLTSYDSLLAQVALVPADTFWYASVGGLRIPRTADGP